MFFIDSYQNSSYYILKALFLIRAYLKFVSNKRVFQKIKSRMFEVLLYIVKLLYEGQSKVTKPYLITFELSKMDIYLDDISLK